MEFRETLLAAQRNQQQKSSESLYYKARFDPPKKEQKQRDRLSANIQKFLAKKDEEEKQKKLDLQRKREELLAMRDPKALRKIQKTLKTIKSANKSVLEDAVDRDNTAVTLTGPEQPDQDDYGYESQEAAALYAKMMQKYSKMPEVPKFPTGNHGVKKDLKGTMERVKHALQHEDDPVPHKRRRRTENGTEKEDSPTRYEPEKKEEKKPDKPKIRKPMPPPMDFNQLLKLAEQKKSEPVGPPVVQKKLTAESENERLMTKKQKQEYEKEMARRQKRQERLDAEKSGGRKPQREEKPVEREKSDTRPSGFGRIPKLNDKTSDRNNSPKPVEKDRGDRDKADKLQRDKDRMRQERERLEREKERVDREKDRIDRERLDRLKAERERIDRELERLSKDKDRLEKTEKKIKVENGRTSDKAVDRSKYNSSDSVKKSIDLKSQNTYRIDKNSNEKRLSNKNSDDRYTNGPNSQGKVVPKQSREQMLKNMERERALLAKQRSLGDGRPENGKRPGDTKVPPKRPEDRGGKPQAGSSKPKISNSFDFDKHVSSLKKDAGGKNGARPAGHDPRRKQQHDDPRKKQNRRVVDSESEYDSEMDDFIDDGDENLDVSSHIKDIFGYDRSKYRDMDDDDDPTMESSFARQQREEFISKKIGIMEDLEDMRLEAMEKKKAKKKRRLSDD